MGWHVWFGFVAVSGVVGIIPGPGVTSIVGIALSSGRGAALAAAAGMAVGNATAMSLSLAGVGALLAASATAFSAVKWAGAAYLVALGLLTVARSFGSAEAGAASASQMSRRAAFLGNVAVGTFHPKTIVFFAAFVPQFIDPHGSYSLQAMVLVVTFCSIVGTTDTLYALAAVRASRFLKSARAARWSRRAGASVLVAAGVAIASSR